MNLTVTVVCPVLPRLSVTRQRHSDSYVWVRFGTLRFQS